jgi:hypothetical protein
MREQLTELLAQLKCAQLAENLDVERQRHLEQACRELEGIIGDPELEHVQQGRLEGRLCVALLHVSHAGFVSPTGNGEPRYLEGPSPMKLTPELVEWARRQTNEEEILAGIKEIRENGGLELHEFLHELEETPRP